MTLLLAAPSAALRSHSSLGLRPGGRRCRPARGSSLLRGRSPPLPSRLSLLAAPGAASLAAAPLRSLPAPPFKASWPRSRLFLRRCGGVVGSSFLFRGCSRVARLVLLRVALVLRSRLRRAFPAVAPSPPSLRFPASPWLSRCAPLSLAARFPPLRSGRSLAARSSFGGRALSPAAVVCHRSWRSPLRADARSLHARSGCSARGGLRMRQSRAQFRWFLGAAAPSPPFSTCSRHADFPQKILASDVRLWYNGLRKEGRQCQHHKS